MLQSSDDKSLATLGGRIRAVRRAKGLRLGSVAQQIELSRTSLSQWESNAVKNPDVERLGKFCKVVDVSLDWLLERKGEDPDLTIPVQASGRRRAAQSRDGTANHGNSGFPHHDISIPEVAPSLAAHAQEIDKTPRAIWSVPHQVIEIGFNAEPSTTVIKRVVARSPDLGLARGDYVLVDTSRNRIDEPGLYIVADPEGRSARRALVVERAGKLEVSALADDLQRSSPPTPVDNLVPLGRVMGIFKPA